MGSKKRQRINRARKIYFMENIYPEVKKEFLNTYLDLEVLNEQYGHHRVMNDLGEYFDFWTTGTLMRVNGTYVKEATADMIKLQMKLLKDSSDRADLISK